MKKSRREFAKKSLILCAGIPLLGSSLLSCSENTKASASKKLNILILGGTSFLGPHQIAYAISRGHKISTFTRGKTKPTIHKEVFSQTEALIGDRKNDLSALKNKKWDVVIDNSGQKVDWTKKSAELLKGNVGQYIYTSSTGVYYPYLDTKISETKELVMVEPTGITNTDTKLEYWYGVMKSNSEKVARDIFGEDRFLAVRPTYMFGPGDKTDRFVHWPIRLARGGDVLVPGMDTDPLQFIDVRDVAEWMIRLAELKAAGTYNAVGPENFESTMTFVEKASKAFDVKSNFIQIDDHEFLQNNNIMHLIPWIMPIDNNYATARVDNALALKNGLTLRDLSTSIKEMHTWWYSDAVTENHRKEFEEKKNGMLFREADLLAKWKAYKN